MAQVIRIAVVAATLVLAACSGSADAGVTTTSASAPVAVTTTQLSVSTTVPESPNVPTKILFVGNSITYYRGGLQNQLSELAASATPPRTLETEESATGGATFEMHWEDMLTPEMIANGSYDIVVLQGDIPETDIDTFKQNARNLVEATRATGAEPILFMAWPYERLGWITIDEIADAHDEIATELSVDIAPVGLAFRRAADERPEMDMLSPDKEHQSFHGAYLAASVVYLTIFGTEHPDTLTHLLSGITITEEESIFLQRIAREAVQDYAGA